MSDPTEIEIEPGEPQEVISDTDVGTTPYIVEVRDADVRFAHKKRQANRGATLTAGQTHTLSNFRGSGIWLAAPEETATVRVRPAGASLQSLPSKDVRIEGDVIVSDAATEGKQDEIISKLAEVVSQLESISENTA